MSQHNFKLVLQTVFCVFVMPTYVLATQRRSSSSIQTFDNHTYYQEIRPLLNQSHILYVEVKVYIRSIISVDDVNQTFTCTGYFDFEWFDEIYNLNIGLMQKNMWRPRFVLSNAVETQDFILIDEHIWLDEPGIEVGMGMGAIFSTSCDLDMSNYPFDEQVCYIEVIFHLKRRFVFLLMSNIVPVVILSFLNLLVLVVPAQSREKMNYGITVLLALFAYLGNITDNMPRSSRKIPLINIYISILIIISVLTLVHSSIITRLHIVKKKDDFGGKRRRTVDKTSPVHVATDDKSCDYTEMEILSDSTTSTESAMPTQTVKGYHLENDRPARSKSQVIWKNVDLISFYLFFCIWLSVTLGFMIKLAL